MGNLKVINVASREEGAETLFQIIKNELDNNRLHVLGLATGDTMIPIYKRWVDSTLNFDNVIGFNLDEYVGIGADNPNSYAYFMNEHLYHKKNFKEKYIMDGLAADLDAECASYEALLEKNPLDLQLLGVGENGHIAFNEPGTSADSTTHVANLTDSTLSVNGRFFGNDEDIPDTAFTMGILTIMRSEKLVLVAFGEKKREAIGKLLEGEITPDWPITKLLDHDDLIVITDLNF